MNKKIWVCQILLVIFLAAALSGCGAMGQTTPSPIPTIVLDAGGAPAGNEPSTAAPLGSGGGVSASGVIVPAQEVTLAFRMGGSVQAVDALVSKQVEAGQVIARLAGSEKLDAAVAAARLELLSAEQALADLQENAEQDRAAAMLRLANAEDAFDTAEKRRGWKEYRVGSDLTIDVARADLILAEDNLKKVEETYGGWADSPEDNLNKAAALSALSAARKARDKAQANLNYLLSMPDEIEVDKAEAELQVARTELDDAQREYERLKDGPNPQALALAQARVDNAKAQLAAAQSSLADLELRAPFTGTVLKLDAQPGQWVTPGQPVLVLANLNPMQVETTDLSERDVPSVQLGQPVTVLVEAINQEVPGHVIEISPLADVLGGDVVYKTTIALDGALPNLRSGMSVEVEFH